MILVFRGGVGNEKKEYNFLKKLSNIWLFQKKAVPLCPNYAYASARYARYYKSVIVWWYEVWYDYCRYVVDAVENE